MLNIAVLGSTNGTDLQSVLDNLKNDSLKDVELKFVLSNKKDAFILKRAESEGFKSIYLPVNDMSREDYDKEVDKLLFEHKVDLVILIGYMKFMSEWFVNKWKNKVMNIHPSLLPMFAGGMDKNVHQEVLDYGCKVSGATLMFIDEGADTGPIILQKAVVIKEDETVDSLKEKVQDVEKELIIKGIELYRDEKLSVEGRIVKVKD